MNNSVSEQVAGQGLSVKNLSFAYGKKTALDDVSFHAQQGRCTILLGPNGAGKSTLFSLVTRLYAAKTGSILINDRDLSKTTYKAMAELGVVFQQATLDLDMSVLQNLRYHAALHGLNHKHTRQRIEQELKRQGMHERRMEKIRQLNGGHRRRVEIARALLHEPSMILLDEPTVGLDIASRQAIVEHMHELVKEDNLAVLWATHLIDEVYDHDHLIILHQGRICADGIVSELLEEYQTDDVSQLFQMLTSSRQVA